jgi:hypothetical protein
MKLLPLTLLLLPFAFVAPTQAQQVNVYGESYCYANVEQYVPGYYDVYGRYIPGYVNRIRNRVSCGENVVVNQQPYYRQRRCNSNAGALIGGGLGSALSGGGGWKNSGSWNRYYGRNYSAGKWNNSYTNKSGWTAFGAGLGAIIFGC